MLHHKRKDKAMTEKERFKDNMLEESNKRSSENHNWLTLDFDSSISLGTLSRIEIEERIVYIGARKGFLTVIWKIFFVFGPNFCQLLLLFAQMLGFMEYTLVYSCVCKLQIKLRF